MYFFFCCAFGTKQNERLGVDPELQLAATTPKPTHTSSVSWGDYGTIKPYSESQ